ncbi:MAG: hypothetical protein COX07_03970 [Bacteroidetes bacterium CG23_combo_of_CG06-09_8_20_14_all_32_9]|nr:MAG: hypothetical protein COX07_03970 [Bacteroidetes bacterium CG23_combo_of_CG06-09_8_20_14_all_32_9]
MDDIQILKELLFKNLQTNIEQQKELFKKLSDKMEVLITSDDYRKENLKSTKKVERELRLRARKTDKIAKKRALETK